MEALKQDEIEILKSALNNDWGLARAPAYPHVHPCIQAKLARRGLLKLHHSTTTYSIYQITDKGIAVINALQSTTED